MAKQYDLSVKVGEYTDRDGNTKSRYQNVGVVMDGANGPYILLNRTFNPAGVPGQADRESIIISMFTPRDENQQAQASQAQAQHTTAKSNGYVAQPDDSDVPF